MERSWDPVRTTFLEHILFPEGPSCNLSLTQPYSIGWGTKNHPPVRMAMFLSGHDKTKTNRNTANTVLAEMKQPPRW